MAESQWRKPPPELVEQFHRLADGMDGVEVRRMFGLPAAFVNGNMAFGVYENTFMVRLSETDRASRLADGWSLFEPMAGRRMREYVALPAEVSASATTTRQWLERSVAFVSSMPPREAKPRRRG